MVFRGLYDSSYELPRYLTAISIQPFLYMTLHAQKSRVSAGEMSQSLHLSYRSRDGNITFLSSNLHFFRTQNVIFFWPGGT
jgi:hypothetical protein